MIVVSGSNTNCCFSVVNKDSKTVSQRRQNKAESSGWAWPPQSASIFRMTCNKPARDGQSSSHLRDYYHLGSDQRLQRIFKKLKLFYFGILSISGPSA